MIKTDAQLARTHEAIADFKNQLEAAESLEDKVARKLSISSYAGMIRTLEFEIERYENAKAARIELPPFSSFNELCPYITDLRIALGWTQENLADQLGVTRQAVNKWEEHEYRGIDVEKLGQILGVIGLRVHIEVTHEVVELVQPSARRVRREASRAPSQSRAMLIS